MGKWGKIKMYVYSKLDLCRSNEKWGMGKNLNVCSKLDLCRKKRRNLNFIFRNL